MNLYKHNSRESWRKRRQETGKQRKGVCGVDEAGRGRREVGVEGGRRRKKSCDYFFLSSLSPLLLSLAYRRPQALHRLFGPSGPCAVRCCQLSSARRTSRATYLSPFRRVDSSTISADELSLLHSRLLLRSNQYREAENERKRVTFFFFSDPPDISPLFPVLLIPIPSAP